jgi:methyl-accepting chemotaxis protein
VEAERERRAAEDRLSIETVSKALETIANGDLTYRITAELPARTEALKQHFNATAEKLQSTMRAIAANTEGVRSSAGEITQSSDDLSRRTEQQAASLEQTAAALDEITATVKKTSDGAVEARNLVGAAKVDAERSGAVVGETVTAMSGIESSSKQISNIIGVIDEIAFQTNLLALNAGVEAARAGDAGRGFAVVATEVRALAQRSADAAKEIKTLISASGAQVETGVRLVGETGKALTRIVEQVNRISTLVTEIAGSAAEQATGLAEVNTAVNQMDQVTQQNAAMVEESTAASHALASEAEDLGRLVGQFRIGEFTRHAAPAKRAHASAKPVSVAPAGKFVAVPRQAATAAAGDWDEF